MSTLEPSAGTRFEEFPLIFELSRPERRAWSLPEPGGDTGTLVPDEFRASAATER